MSTRPTPAPSHQDPRYLALVNLVERTGATGYRLEHTDEATPPVAWVAVAEYSRITAGPTVHHHAEAAAGMHPLIATHRLVETLIDGAVCQHCGRPAMLEPLGPELVGEVHPIDVATERIICHYRFDPELVTYRRGCEGDT